MLKQFQLFLGPARVRALILLLAVTGLASVTLNAVDAEWVPGVQTLLVLAFVIGSLVIIGTRMEMEERLRWLAMLAPALGAVILGLTVLPQFLLPLMGAAVGWLVAGMFLFRRRIPTEYQQAIRHLRKGEYAEATEKMNELIKADPEKENYYRFRAEIFRLWGKLDRARKDYQKMTELAPLSAVAFNGLAEVDLQSGRYADAHAAAEEAYRLAPDEWVAAYNLGMIEDRLGSSEAAIHHLNHALEMKVPEARHRLLIHLYLARAYSRLQQADNAEQAVNRLKQNRRGLEEWQDLLVHEQAATLRAVLEADVTTAQRLIDGDLTVEALA